MKYATISRADAALFLVCVATFLSLFLFFFWDSVTFSSWRFVLRFYGLKQDATWGFPIGFSVGYGLVSTIAVRAVLSLPAYRSAAGLKALEGTLLGLLLSGAGAAVAYVASRPPNYPLSILAAATLVTAAVDGAVLLAATVARTRRKLSSWKEEIKAAPFLVGGTLIGLSCLVGVATIETALRIHNPFLLRVKGDRIVLQSGYRFDIQNKTPGKLEGTIVHERNSIGFRGGGPDVGFSTPTLHRDGWR